MKYLAVLAIVAFLLTNILLNFRPDWFGFLFAIPGRDKMLHFLIAGALSFLVVGGFSTTSFRGRRVGPLWCLVAVASLITVDELIQLAIPFRTFALLDLGWSYAGVAVFGLVGVLWGRWIPAR